jgi:hypothetical protein
MGSFSRSLLARNRHTAPITCSSSRGDTTCIGWISGRGETKNKASWSLMIWYLFIIFQSCKLYQWQLFGVYFKDWRAEWVVQYWHTVALERYLSNKLTAWGKTPCSHTSEIWKSLIRIYHYVITLMKVRFHDVVDATKATKRYWIYSIGRSVIKVQSLKHIHYWMNFTKLSIRKLYYK